MKIKEILLEVKVIPHAMAKDELEPIHEDDTILVYHGTSDPDTIISVSKHGLTGDVRANRKYSFEFNNNPKGLFVTPDFKTAKEFGSYVIELHVKVSDLDTPVWPGGGFTVQGQMAQYFDDDEERKALQLQRRKEYSGEDQPDYIRNSDRPELAATLMAYGERQALFVGDLNANSVRAIWVSSDPSRVDSRYERYTIPQFLKKLENEGIATAYGDRFKDFDSKEKKREVQDKLFKPRDRADLNVMLDKLHSRFHMPKEEIIEILERNPDYVRRLVWSDRQFNEIMQQLAGKN